MTNIIPQPSQNTKLENEVLATILLNPGRGLCKGLSPDVFVPPNDVIFSAMQALDSTGSLTSGTLIHHLDIADKLDAIGRGVRLADIQTADELALGETFRFYTGELKELYSRRRTLSALSKFLNAADSGSGSIDIDGLVVELKSLRSESSFSMLLESSAMGGADFLTCAFPERERLVGDWFQKGDQGFVFAPRGVGKTWFVHALISSLTSGKNFGKWEVEREVKVCLLDGEMPPDAVQERLAKLKVKGSNLTVLSHQMLFEKANSSFQLGEPEHRAGLLDFCLKKEIDVLVIDNLSSVSSVSENDNDEWKSIGDWLLDFRRNGISVIVVHHAGRNGAMRGASRREDAAFWVISLTDSRERTATTDGARFLSTFTKNRNDRQWPEPIDWHVTESDDGTFEIKTASAGVDELVYQCIVDGVDRCSDIAEELGIGKSTVSKASKRLENEGKVRIDGSGNQSRYRSA